jgi:acylglycerol lipase
MSPLRKVLPFAAGLILCQCHTVQTPGDRAATFPRHAVLYADGKKMPAETWPKQAASRQPKAILICLHGLSGSGHDFWPLGESLVGSGYRVIAPALRGQGLDPTPSERGDIKSAAVWRRDLAQCLRAAHRDYPHTPIIVVGESLGALITIDSLRFDPEAKRLISGLILLAPPVELRASLRPRPLTKAMFRNLARLFPHRRLSLESLGQSDIRVTSQATLGQQIAKTPHFVSAHTLRLFRAMDQMHHAAMASAAHIEVPTLVLYSPHDAVTEPDGVVRFTARLATTDKTSVVFPQSHHLLLHDVERARAVKTIKRWLDSRAHDFRRQP